MLNVTKLLLTKKQHCKFTKLYRYCYKLLRNRWIYHGECF